MLTHFSLRSLPPGVDSQRTFRNPQSCQGSLGYAVVKQLYLLRVGLKKTASRGQNRMTILFRYDWFKVLLIDNAR